MVKLIMRRRGMIKKIEQSVSTLLLLIMSVMGIAAATEERFVVMDFGALDTIAALEKGEVVVALPKGNLPEYLAQFDNEQYHNTGGMKEPDIPLIESLNPTGIIISPRQGAYLEALEGIAPVYNFGVEGDYLPAVEKNILSVAALLGVKEMGEVKVEALLTTLENIKARAQESDKRAILLLHNDGKLILSTESKYADLLHNQLGVARAEEEKRERFLVDPAYLSSLNPDLIYIVDRSAAIGAEAFDLDYFTQESLVEVEAVKSSGIHYLTPKLWYLSGNGLESIRLQAEEVERSLME